MFFSSTPLPGQSRPGQLHFMVGWCIALSIAMRASNPAMTTIGAFRTGSRFGSALLSIVGSANFPPATPLPSVASSAPLYSRARYDLVVGCNFQLPACPSPSAAGTRFRAFCWYSGSSTICFVFLPFGAITTGQQNISKIVCIRGFVVLLRTCWSDCRNFPRHSLGGGTHQCGVQ